MSGRDVVISGLGLVSPHGDDLQLVFDAMLNGQSAIGLWGREGLPPAAVASAAYSPERCFTKLQLVGVDRVSQMAVTAAESAKADARWPSKLDPERIGVFIGSGMGGASALEDGYEAARAGRRVSPLSVVAAMTNAPAAHIAIRAGAQGPVYTYSVACASSAVAIAEAAKAIAAGEIDIAIAGGTEALLVPGVVRAWQALQTLATPDPIDPSQSCRPFDVNRSGFALGEGAAMLILESRQHAIDRQAPVRVRFAGSGVSCDAQHLTKPQAPGQVRALRNALRASGLTPRDIGYCNAHGTATRVGDVVECEALRTVWGDDIDALRVSSTKSMHGHLLGAAGALEAVVTVLALEQRCAPATATCLSPDAACDVPLILGSAASLPNMHAAISNSFAFGGTNVVLAFTRND
ncbi:MAG: beta-ketoacyl-[acyl-carrier-protein] synthase family protein [Pseudomonadota bacterium]|nr:beta-ketoacyl-[acyl-carrier-protein] synthase family protein [Pseudomonadota bacterium]